VLERVVGSKADLHYWDWKYFQSPDGPSPTVVVLHNDQVVGIQGALTRYLFMDGRRVGAHKDVDLAVCEEHRRLDVYMGMVAALRKKVHDSGVAVSYAVTNEKSAELSKGITGKKKLCAAPSMRKWLRTAPLFRERLPRWVPARLLSIPIDAAIRLKNPLTGSRSSGTRVTSPDDFDERFDALFHAVQADYGAIAERSSAYLRYRYTEAPHMRYRTICIERKSNRELLAYAVVGDHRWDFPVGDIYEIMSCKDPRLFRELCGQVLKHFYKRGAAKVRCWMMPSVWMHAELSRFGFKPSAKESRGIYSRCWDTACQKTGDDPNSWYISISDSDTGFEIVDYRNRRTG
jgi:hypothetical protein